MSEARAIVFDLDDTLYPLEWFVSSGFRRVSCVVEAEFGIPRRTIMQSLGELRRSHSGRELQALCEQFRLPERIVPSLINEIRTHRPRMRLPEPSVRVLRALRPRWRIGVLTNGMPSVQRRKVEALRIESLVDLVMYAEEHAPGGKPSPHAFRAIRERLDVSADRTVMVGDDPVADIVGARREGFQTIFLSASDEAWPAALPAPGARLASIEGVPWRAERLLDEGTRHVA
jgi:putative hydrolase of the HAD superfamily